MATATYTDKPRHDRHVSLTKLTLVLANLGLWAGLIVATVLIAR